MLLNARGWLVANDTDPTVIQYTTVRTTSLTTLRPLGIVWHGSGGRGNKIYAESLSHGIASYNPRKDLAVSWNALIAKDGTIYQSASFHVGTWHVGRPGTIGIQRWASINKVTISIELENAGRLMLVDSKFYCSPFYVDPTMLEKNRLMYPALEIQMERAVMYEGVYFDNYTAKQIESAKSILTVLVNRFQWQPEVCILTHSQFDLGRKEDPGALWASQILPGLVAEIFKP
jgi:N-acetyl-anhydromuramyl-L-alanine amidase AmpD